MSQIFKPRRSSKGRMNQTGTVGKFAHTVLGAGELFLERQQDDNSYTEGSGSSSNPVQYRMKIGDGITTYSNLGYADQTQVFSSGSAGDGNIVDNIEQNIENGGITTTFSSLADKKVATVSSNSSSTVPTALNTVSSNNTLKDILGALKQAVSLCSTSISSLIEDKAEKVHEHTKSDITDFAHEHEWSDINNTPDSYPPSSHTHNKSDINNFAHTHTRSDITNFAHSHSKSDITDFSHTHSKSDITNFAHNHVRADITDFPSSMPASDVYSWAKAANKPSYTYSEVGAAPSVHGHSGYFQGTGVHNKNGCLKFKNSNLGSSAMLIQWGESSATDKSPIVCDFPTVFSDVFSASVSAQMSADNTYKVFATIKDITTTSILVECIRIGTNGYGNVVGLDSFKEVTPIINYIAIGQIIEFD